MFHIVSDPDALRALCGAEWSHAAVMGFRVIESSDCYVCRRKAGLSTGSVANKVFKYGLNIFSGRELTEDQKAAIMQAIEATLPFPLAATFDAPLSVVEAADYELEHLLPKEGS